MCHSNTKWTSLRVRKMVIELLKDDTGRIVKFKSFSIPSRTITTTKTANSDIQKALCVLSTLIANWKFNLGIFGFAQSAVMMSQGWTSIRRVICVELRYVDFRCIIDGCYVSVFAHQQGDDGNPSFRTIRPSFVVLLRQPGVRNKTE